MEAMGKFLRSTVIALTVTTSLASPGSAAENGTLAYMIGSPAIFTGAFPPVPGLFGVSQSTYSSANSLYGSDGHRLAVPFKLSVYAETLRIMAAYDATVFGAKLYSQFILPMAYAENTVYGVKQSGGGAANLVFSPFILDWKLGEFQDVVFGVNIASQFSSYSSTTFSVGQGYTSFQPVFAYRFSDPNGFEFGISPSFLFNTENAATNYKSGTALVVDFSSGWHFGPWMLGVVGGYAQQLTDDVQNGISIGNRLQEFRMGPSITLNAGPFIINANYQPTLYVENGAKSNTFWFNIAAPLWVPGR